MEKLNSISKDLISEVDISISYFLLSLVITIICSYLIKLSYIKYGKSLNNRENFSNTFVILGITTCVVITIVKYSLALSLGLVGALSIVRFRAAIKEPEELVFLFLIIVIGLSSGANQFIISIIFTFVSLVIIYLTSKKRSKKPNIDTSTNVLTVKGAKDDHDKWYATFINSITPYVSFLRLSQMVKKGESIEIVFHYELNINDDQSQEFFNKIVTDNKNLDIQIYTDVVVPE